MIAINHCTLLNINLHTIFVPSATLWWQRMIPKLLNDNWTGYQYIIKVTDMGVALVTSTQPAQLHWICIHRDAWGKFQYKDCLSSKTDFNYKCKTGSFLWGFLNWLVRRSRAVYKLCLAITPWHMDKQLHPLQCVGWNYLSIPKLQCLHRWSLGLDK